jgi:hypothetical protein
MQGNGSSHNGLSDMLRSEQKLRAFIEAALQGPTATQEPMLLVARSATSIVTRTIFGLSDRLASRQVSCRMIFTCGADTQLAGTQHPSFGHEIRLISDLRILDGHEQLVIGPGSIWFGDCMRRDPAKRDGYESYTHGDTAAAKSARHTFDKLWRLATRLHACNMAAGELAKLPDADRVPMEDLPGLDLQGTLDAWRPQTRH